MYKLFQRWKHPKTFKIFKAILVWRTIAVVSPKAGRFHSPTKSTVQQRCSTWQSSLQEAFWRFHKEEITSAQVLGDFDKSKPSVIQSECFQEWIRHIFVARWQDNCLCIKKPYCATLLKHREGRIATHREEISAENGLLFKGHRLIVPEKLHAPMQPRG